MNEKEEQLNQTEFAAIEPVLEDSKPISPISPEEQGSARSSKKRKLILIVITTFTITLFLLLFIWFNIMRNGGQSTQPAPTPEVTPTPAGIISHPLEARVLELESDLKKADPKLSIQAFPAVDNDINWRDVNRR